jgi:hypothetical protein
VAYGDDAGPGAGVQVSFSLFVVEVDSFSVVHYGEVGVLFSGKTGDMMLKGYLPGVSKDLPVG